MMDILLLSITGSVLRWKSRVPRILLAGAVGATLSILFLWVQIYDFILGLYKVALAVLMVKIAFPIKGMRQLLQGSIIFYLGAWVVGGIFYAFAPSEKWFTGIFFWLLLILSALLAAMGLTYWRNHGQKRVWQGDLLLKIHAEEIKVRALVDSGNQLVDPLTGNPVIIVEYQALAHLLPPGWSESAATDESLRPRYIPYTSMGNPQGLLLGFRPTRVELYRDNEVIHCHDAIVALSHQRLDPSGHYQALVPTAWEH
ncbi:sporulation sigma-e factor-processing peptidase [Heliorestis convoluta]|uniref:Sporulation sigma-e factor-processing peptidase n=2 Tax=Heliorestis convoluta TaxID=356322 RepID=A0A5Q2N1Z9_9FIRM|nr:sporulation sigma-e factor-processing peptidase [Heliorestis convoluta]